MARPGQTSSIGGKRRSPRFPLLSPVEAAWQAIDGRIFREAGQATEVNAHGGLLELKTYPTVGKQIELINLQSRESSPARVVGIRRTSEGLVLGVGVELLAPSESFWGIKTAFDNWNAAAIDNGSNVLLYVQCGTPINTTGQTNVWQVTTASAWPQTAYCRGHDLV